MEDWPQEDRSATAVAHVAEFVALPGKAAEIRSLIPAAIRQASPGSEGFAGSMVLFSEQEERLVTVITLWKKSDKRNHWIENSKRLEILVQPYVDRWLRTRKLAAVICPS